MQIAIYTNRFPELTEPFVLNQITGLMDRGHEVDIYALAPGNAGDAFPQVDRFQMLDRTYYAPEFLASRLMRIGRALGLLARYGPRHPRLVARCLNFVKFGRPAASTRLLHTAVPFLGRKPYDVIHCQFGPLGTTACLLRLSGVLKGKVVTSFRGYDMGILQRSTEPYKLLFADGDLFLPVSETFKQQLIDAGCERKRIAIHQTGIDLEQFAFAPRNHSPGETIRIVSVARLVEKKGIEYGIRAVAKLAERFPDIEYRIIGEGPLRGRLETVIHELGMRENVQLHGPMSRTEVCRWLERSHIMLAPSLTAANGDREGIPNSLKEAMAMGLPVLSTKHSGIPELVRDGVSGYLVPEGNLEALIEKLAHLIDHPERWPEMGRLGRRAVAQDFDAAVLSDRLLQAYEQLVAAGRGAG